MTLVGLFPELIAPGGIQRASCHMAAVLASDAKRRGVSCGLYSLNDPEERAEGRVGDVQFGFAGFGRSKARFVRAALSPDGGRPSLVLAAHPNLAPLAWAIRVLTGARMVVVTWGIDVWDPLPVMRRMALRSSDAVLAISGHTAAAVCRTQGVHPRRVHVLPLAIEPAFWDAARESRPRPSTTGVLPKRFLLSVGRLVASASGKGVDTTIRALGRLSAEFPDLEYVVVGDGDDRPRLERLAAASGVRERVHFRGLVPSAELAALYEACEAMVLPSKVEGFGLVFLEAMAFAKPVVGGAHGGTPDVVEEGVTGFLTRHGDAEALSDLLRQLLSDERLRSEMGRRGLERVEACYLFEHFRARLAAILDALIEDGCLPNPADRRDAGVAGSRMTVPDPD